MAHLRATGLGNPVTAVLMAYRAIDTLLEVVVLLLALVGVWSLAADRLWGGRPVLGGSGDRDRMLVFLGRLLPPAVILSGDPHLLDRIDRTRRRISGSDDPCGDVGARRAGRARRRPAR